MRTLPPAMRAASPVELAQRLQVERRGKPFVLYRDADGHERIVELGGRSQPLCIGRQASSDVALPWDAGVSRAHALLERVGDEWTLVDDGLSRNGSYVNGHRIRGRRRLRDGDCITVGQTLLVYVEPAGERVGGRATEALPEANPPALSAAQRRVLEALCRPIMQARFTSPPSNREIAQELFLSVETVKSHLHALFDIFGVADNVPQNRKRAELARRALERGVLSA
jgi:hypothetical protein